MADTDSERIAELEAEIDRLTARLREVDHRIKNDLQLMNSVFVLQLRKTPEAGQALVRGALERVSAVSAVHRRLDTGDDPKRFEVSALVRDLVEDAAGGARREDVRVELELAPVTVPARQAAPLALIVGELVRNSLKHAFPDRPGLVRVSLAATTAEVTLSVRDDGVGLAGGAPPSGFGATLVTLLAQQLRGKAEFAAAEPGVAATLRFPRSE